MRILRLSGTFSGRAGQQGAAEMPIFLGLGKGRRERVERARSEGETGGYYAIQKALRPCAPRLYSSSCLV